MRFSALAWSVAVALVYGSSVGHAQCALPYTLVDGQPLDATQVMANFNALATCMSSGGSTNSVQYNSGTGGLAGLGPLTDGQLAIGSTGAAPQAQTLTAGSGVTITNGSGSATIASTAGTAGTGLFRQIMSATPTSASTGLTTWLNQGSASISDSAVGVSMTVPANGSTSVTGRYVAAPSPPYTITALMSSTRNNTSISMAGIGWYDGTSKLQLLSNETNLAPCPILRVRPFASVTSPGTPNFTSQNSCFPVPTWLQIKDDGTNVSFAYSQDGVNFLTVYSIAKASGYLGATGYSNIIFFINPGPGLPYIATLLSWTQT